MALFDIFLQYNKNWTIVNESMLHDSQCKMILRFAHFVPRRKEVWNFHKIINLKYQLFEFPSSVYPTLPYFGCHRLWDIITIQLIMRGNLFENSWFPGSRVEIREKWIETGVEGMHDFIITGGSFRSRAWRVVFLPPPPSSRENAPAYFQSSNLN